MKDDSSHAAPERTSAAFKYGLRIQLLVCIAWLFSGSAAWADSQVLAWGYSLYGITAVPPDLTNAVAIAAGSHHSAALKADGTAVGWGDFGGAYDGWSNIVMVGAGAYGHGLAILENGSLVAACPREPGQCSGTPNVNNAIAVATGYRYGLALREDGTVVAWGSNEGGKTEVPPGLSNVVAISASSDHTLALRTDGTVVAWGMNQYGQSDVPPGITNAVGIAAGGFHSLVLRSDGTVIAWGDNYQGVVDVPAGLTNVVAISAYCHNLALKSDGTVVTWGDNSYGQTNLPPDLANVAAISAGGFHTVALTGQLPPRLQRSLPHRASFTGKTVFLDAGACGTWPMQFQWRWNGTALAGETNRILSLTNLRPNQAGLYSVEVHNAFGSVTGIVTSLALSETAPQISAQPTPQATFLGGRATFRVGADGSWPLHFQWRRNGVELAAATSDVLSLTDVLSTDFGDYSVVISNAFGAVTSAIAPLVEVRVLAWGANASGQAEVLPSLTDVVSLAAGGTHNLALKRDGTVVAWGDNGFYRQCEVPAGLSNVVAITCGQISSMALRNDGTLLTWGHESQYQPALSNVVLMAGGFFHHLAVQADGKMTFWGSHLDWCQHCAPPGLRNVVAVAAGEFHTVALTGAGKVAAWGGNEFGQCNVPLGLANIVAVAAGRGHSVALRADGTVVAWGSNEDDEGNYLGQATVPNGLSNVVAIAAGYRHSLALKADGTVVGWGANDLGQASIPAFCSNVVAIAAGGSHNIALRGDGSPIITVPPRSRIAAANEAITLHVLALGTPSLRYQWQFNGSDLVGATNAWLTLESAQSSRAGAYRVVVSNALGSVTSAVAIVTVEPGISLAEAVDAPELVWRTGELAWSAQTNITHDGVDAAQTGTLTNYSETWLETTVTGPGLISFWWKISTLRDWYYLSFRIDCDWMTNCTGETDWRRHSYYVPAGTHNLRWDYSRHDEETGGLDAGWLDEINFTTNAPMAPTIATAPQSRTVTAGDDVTIVVQPEGTEPFEYQWRFQGSDLPRETSQFLRVTNVQLAQAGAYDVVVRNLAGETTSPAAMLGVNSSPVAWTWAQSGGGSGGDAGSAIAVDHEGNVYVGGQFTSVATFGTNSVTSNAEQPLFLAKYDVQGNVLWARALNSAGHGMVTQLKADGVGKLHMLGWFNSSLTLGTNELTAAGFGAFVAKLDTSGSVLWVQSVSGIADCMSDSGLQLAVDQSGNAYLLSDFRWDTSVGGIVLTNAGGTDFLLARFAPDGAVQWAQAFGTPKWDRARSVAVDSAGQVYFSGEFDGTLTLGTNVVTGRYIADAPTQYGIFIAKCDPQGQVLWVQLGETNHLHGYELAVDPADRLYARACFYGTTVMGTNVLRGLNEGGDYFLERLDAEGHAVWACTIANIGFGTSGGYRLAADVNRVYLHGPFISTVIVNGKTLFYLPEMSSFVAAWNSAGQLLWTEKLPRYVEDFTPDRAGGIVVVGAFDSPIRFGTNWLDASGGNEAFVAKLANIELPRFAPPSAGLCVSNGQFHLQLLGCVRRGSLVIEVSTDLLNWTGVVTNSSQVEPFKFSHPITISPPACFFRARQIE